mgnify:CR=1 FL=1
MSIPIRRFSGSFGVLLRSGVSLGPTTWWPRTFLPAIISGECRGAAWRRVFGPWTAGRAIKVVAGPATRPSRDYSRSSPSRAPPTAAIRRRRGCCSTHPRRRAGESSTSRATCRKRKCRRRRVFIPAGKTDAMVTPITTGPVPTNGIVGTIRARLCRPMGSRARSACSRFLYGTVAQQPERRRWRRRSPGTVTLQSAAPPGGTTVRLVSSDTSLAQVPPTVFIPAGAMDATFTASTSAVVRAGANRDRDRAPTSTAIARRRRLITLVPAGSPAPPPSLSSLDDQPAKRRRGRHGTTVTVRLTSPAPAGGAVIQVERQHGRTESSRRRA